MTWKDKAAEALDTYNGDGTPEESGTAEMYDYGFGTGVVFDSPSGEFIVFKDNDAADYGAEMYVKQMLEDEPGIFNQDWLSQHVKMTPTDIRIIASEQGDSYTEDIGDERAIEEAGFDEDDYGPTFVKAAKKFRDAEDALTEYQADTPENQFSEDVEQKLIEKMNDLEETYNEVEKNEISDLAERAREEISDRIASDLRETLESDPLSYFVDELGYDRDAAISQFMHIDLAAAIEDALDQDGRAHFLSSYDGDEMDLDGGFVAFRIN